MFIWWFSAGCFLFNRKSAATGTTGPKRAIKVIPVIVYEPFIFHPTFPFMLHIQFSLCVCQQICLWLAVSKILWGQIDIFSPLKSWLLNPICMLFFTWNSLKFHVFQQRFIVALVVSKIWGDQKKSTSKIFILSPILLRLLSLAFLWHFRCLFVKQIWPNSYWSRDKRGQRNQFLKWQLYFNFPLNFSE